MTPIPLPRSRATIAALTAIPVSLAFIVASGTPAHALERCTIKALKAHSGNGNYVATEEDYAGSYKGMLRARSAGIGGWEKFRICVTYHHVGPNIVDDYFTIKAHSGNGLYVRVEQGYSSSDYRYGMLRAASTSVSPGNYSPEKFYGGSVLPSPRFMSAWNRKWVATEEDYTGVNKGMLRARTTNPAGWETFKWVNP